MTSERLQRTPLHDLIQAQGARMTAFSGWDMPVQFAGLQQEHAAVRTRAGMFDISHMGKFALRGDRLVECFQTLVPSDLERLQPGQAQYTVLLNANGGIIDDIIFYYQGKAANGEQRAVAIVNAGTCAKDRMWIGQHLADTDIELCDLSASRVLLAVQGPEAIARLQPSVAADLSPLRAFEHLETEVCGQPAFIARTGYTGEDGVELMLPPDAGRQLWHRLQTVSVEPCGLGARDTLRLEAAMALYGQDIDETRTPLEAGLRWIVHFDRKQDFIGREVLERQVVDGVPQRLVGLQMHGRHIARHGYAIYIDGQSVGTITSGTLSPTLSKAIALAYVPSDRARTGQAIEVEIRGKLHPAEIVKKPFYRSPAPAPR
ncbi:glycine cleavage system T protein [Rubidibacter lacunae KORDI 51-2]|uniref:Aminomethyltransferase n=1 Tax=Rubidibacter lacunae KORDI 51-2 TaxID=582515 RepID=U5DMU6_9CHRO|nr:glycine cleavage system aminomethyltransferase GcvT [Rubidibacter lacunae]ERN42162.1 glycine cleavage system T protein [Rubidibacter lacunae KORDI 51-2]